LEYLYAGLLRSGGLLQKSIHFAGASLAAEDNPWGEERQKRAEWAKDLPVKAFTEETEILYFPCCVP